MERRGEVVAHYNYRNLVFCEEITKGVASSSRVAAIKLSGRAVQRARWKQDTHTIDAKTTKQ